MRRKEHSRSPDREDAKRCRLQPDTSELGISSAVENRVLELKNRCLVDEQAPENYVPPLGKDTVDAPDSSAFPLLSNFMDFLEGKRQVMLLMGDPGSGKTFFLRQLERELWEKYHGLNDPIPIFVSLSDVDNVTSDLLGQALRSHLFDDDHIRHLKRSNRQIILICDGYDEIHVQRNIYNSNKFNTPEHGRVKLVIACRSCKIGRNSDGQFRPESTNRYDLTDRDLFQKVAMAPFTNRMVVEYVEKYVARQFRLVAPQSFGGPQSATHQSQPETPPSSSFESMRVWAVPQYLETLRDIPSLMELVVNPFILSIVLTMLSTMTNPEREVLRSPISFDALYKHIFGRWIKVAERRLYSRVMARDEDMEFRDLRCSGFEENCMAYMKRLVVKILGNQKKASPVRFIINHGAVWRARCLETVTGESLLQESVPLTRSGTSSRFIFPSHFDYMFSLLVFDPENLGMNDTDTEASSTDADDSASDNSIFSPELVLSKFGTVRAFDKGHPLGITNIAKRSMAVQFLADRVQNCQFFKKQLVEIVRESRNNKDTDQTLASNAVTILVRSGMRFNSADLRGIKIKGANLTGGEFDSADLRDADLTDVIFDKCWLRQAKLQGAKLKGAEFGEKSLDLQYVPNTTAYSVDGALYAVAFTNGSITIFDATNWNPVHTHQVSKKSVTALAFSPKGGLLAYGDRMGMLRRWNYNSGALMAFSDGHGDYINGLVYSPDGNQIATADDKKVAMWDADTGGCVNVMVPCTEGASSIAFSPDGKQLVSGGSDGIIRLWNLETDSLVCNLAGHGGAVSNVLFSPDGRHIASSSSDRTVRIWSATTGTWSLETTCIGHSERVISIAYSPDGQHLASCSEDGTIRTWDSRSGGSGPVFQGHTDHVIGVAYSQCGTQLTSCSRDKVLRLWDYRAAVKGAVLFGRTNNIPSGMYPYSTVKRQNSDSDKTIQPTRPRPLARTSESPSFGTTDTKLFAVSSNASLTASASANGNTHTINVSFVATSEDRYTLNGHEEISIISFSPNNQSIASGDFNGVLRVWNIESGEAIWTREEHDGKITGIAYSSNGEQIVSSGKDGTVRLWGTLSGDPGHVFETDDGEIECVAFSPCGSWVASGDENGVLMLWDPVNLIPGPVFANGHNGTVNCITFSPDGNHLVSAGSDNTVRIWDINRKTVVHVLEEHVDLVRCLAFSPTGERLVSGSDDCTMKIWNVATGVLESTLDHKEGLATVSFSSDGTQLWTGTKDRRIHEWTWASTGHDTAIIATSAFSKDGQHVASSLGGDAVQLWDTDSGKLRHILISHSATIESVSFSPVGDFVAIGSSDKMARIWDTTTGTCLFQLEGHSGIVTSVVFSPDGTQVATSSLDQTLRWWNLSVPGSESLSMHGIHWAAVGIYTHDDSGLFHAPVYSPDGSEISVISGQHGILRFDTRSKGPLPALVGHSDTATCIAYSPSGDRIATSSEDKTARIWDPQTGNELLKFVGHEDSVTSIAFSPFSYHIATSSADWSIRLWNVAGNTPYQGAVGKVLLRHTAPVLCIAYSPDGRFLASGSEDRTMRLWDPLTGDPLAVVGDFAVGVKTIQWRNSARGGLVLVTGCKENPLRVWEVVNVKRRQYEVRRYWGAGVESLAVSGTLISDRNMD